MTDVLRNQTLALAAAMQALLSVVSIARRGHSRRSDTEPCLQGLLQTYEGDVEQLYGGVAPLRAGLEQLVEQLARPTDPELTRYLVAVIYLERRLRKQPEVLRRLGQGLDSARRQREYFGGYNPNVVSNLGGLYGETISTLKPRIMVQGERAYLEQAANADQIRAQLLAAIRAISLWHEAGGTRWRLLFGRNKYLRVAEKLRSEAAAELETTV